MRLVNAIGLGCIPSGVWKSLYDKRIEWLSKSISKTMKMPDKLRISILVPIYKNKGVIHSCTNYLRIRLMSHTMKLWEGNYANSKTGIKWRINSYFLPGRSTIEAI